MSLALSRIDYIVYNNPTAVRRLIYQAGYEPPKRTDRLSKAMKALIRKQGKPAIKRLLLLHPDRAALLQSEDANTKQQGCSNCKKRSTQPNVQSQTTPIERLDTASLQQQLREVRAALKVEPDNDELAKQLQLTRAELTLRQEHQVKQKPESATRRMLLKASSDILIALSLTLLAGVIIGGGLKTKING